MIMRLVLATNNQGKIREFKAMLADSPWEVVGLGELGIQLDVEETADTFEGNAIIKATRAMQLSGEVAVSDDSGICVEALDGAPGVYSARYSGEGATDYQNNIKLLEMMANHANRKAKFVCAIAVVSPDNEIKTMRGEFEGEIAYSMQGSGGFGFDVLFYLSDYKMTSAQIPAELKNKISHRAKALEKLRDYLEDIE